MCLKIVQTYVFKKPKSLIKCLYYHNLLNEKKNMLKVFCPKTGFTKKPSGCRIAHYGYLLISCPRKKTKL